MGVISEAVRHLMAVGVTGEDLVAAIADMEAASKPSAARIPQKIAYTPEFEAFWKAYPTDPNMSKKEAFDVWKRIGPQEQQMAMEAVPMFKEWIKTQGDYRTIHACRFLSKKRYEGHAAGPKLVVDNPGVYVTKGTPDWERYAAAYRAQKGREPPTDKNGGWFFAETSCAKGDSTV